ncbi:hypothetical protein Tsubulata_015547, partial [Turnera subulata]
MMTMLAAKGDKGDEEIRDWSSLPELILNILKKDHYYYLKDVCAFRGVCKAWNSIPPPPPKDHLNFIEGLPKLLHIGMDRLLIKFYEPILCRTITKSIPEMGCGRVISHSKDGWLLMAHHRKFDMFFFINPYTRENIQLPRLPENIFVDGISFSSIPTSPDCMIVGVVAEARGPRFVYISRGEDDWHISPYKRPWKTEIVVCSSIIHNGRFYFMVGDGSVLVYDPRQERNNALQSVKRPCTSIEKGYLVVCDGELLAVVVLGSNLPQDDITEW